MIGINGMKSLAECIPNSIYLATVVSTPLNNKTTNVAARLKRILSDTNSSTNYINSDKVFNFSSIYYQNINSTDLVILEFSKYSPRLFPNVLPNLNRHSIFSFSPFRTDIGYLPFSSNNVIIIIIMVVYRSFF